MFSTIDLASAYHQMLLQWSFKFLQSSIWPCFSSISLSKNDDNHTDRPTGVEAYLDYVICYGVTQQDQDANLQRVLYALNDAGLKVNMHQCKFNQTSLHFLGNTISKDGQQVNAVANAPAPHDTPSLGSFLGLASWYSKLISDFATVVEPLCSMERLNPVLLRLRD